ncbi:MAG: hypothetical protein ALECFALPRED_005865 [Alectoria fallacina]|uniref:Uncharacterized protein n=1 Tax=Alectoria fallacina TaxID=1903189 RepID=A0A8H3IVH2_9LECA|nr:MAG: hypothetical protein ALECFALPRED_005865 [Alectoria fallacina]
MQVFSLFFLGLSFRLIVGQSTLSATAYVGLVPDYPNYDSGPSNVYTAIDNATATAAVTDPCGPLNQPSPNPAGNTCNVSIIGSKAPTPYGVQCLTDYTDSHIDFGACSNETIPAICDKLADPAVQNETWIWASGATPNVCYLGFYLPPYDGSAQKPDKEKCVSEIFRPMLGYCNPATGHEVTEGMYNLGMVNVKVKPDETQNGQAVDVGYPSYVMATTQLTAEAG